MAAQQVTVLQPKKESKPAVRDDFFEGIQRMYDSIARRAFEFFESDGGIFGRDLDHWFKAESELLHPVHMEVTESEGGFSVHAEVPGFSVKDLQISVEPQRLTITGKRETKEEKKAEKTIYQERCSDELMRVIDLPAAVNPDKVKATLENGVLALEMPKAAPPKQVTIQPKVA